MSSENDETLQNINHIEESQSQETQVKNHEGYAQVIEQQIDAVQVQPQVDASEEGATSAEIAAALGSSQTNLPSEEPRGFEVTPGRLVTLCTYANSQHVRHFLISSRRAAKSVNIPHTEDESYALHAVAMRTKDHDVSELLSTLIRARAKVDAVDKFGQTPLHIAASVGNNIALRELVRAKANPNLVDNLNESPIFKACLSKKKQSARILLRANADVSIKNADGHTADRYMKNLTNLDNMGVVLSDDSD